MEIHYGYDPHSGSSVLPELNYYCGGTAAFADLEKNTFFWHLVKDRDTQKNQINIKFPGGRAHDVDLDGELHIRNIKEHLKYTDFDVNERKEILRHLASKLGKYDKYERTFIREYLGETGYYPISFDFLCEITKRNGHVQKFYFPLELVGPHSDLGIKPKKGELLIIKKVTSAKEFKPVDEDVIDSRFCLETEKILGMLCESHKKPFKEALCKLRKDNSESFDWFCQYNKDFYYVYYELIENSQVQVTQ